MLALGADVRMINNSPLTITTMIDVAAVCIVEREEVVVMIYTPPVIGGYNANKSSPPPPASPRSARYMETHGDT